MIIVDYPLSFVNLYNKCLLNAYYVHLDYNNEWNKDFCLYEIHIPAKWRFLEILQGAFCLL